MPREKSNEKQTPKPQDKSKECPGCRLHADNHARFYTEPVEVGTLRDDGSGALICSVCGYRVR